MRAAEIYDFATGELLGGVMQLTSDAPSWQALRAIRDTPAAELHRVEEWLRASADDYLPEDARALWAAYHARLEGIVQ